jgi:arylsulfatase A-like enzyme/glycosyltransferase involved in cell wall biosynthesis
MNPKIGDPGMTKDILVVSIDNLRFDCVQYQDDRRELGKYDVLKHLATPTLDRIAEKGLCFTRCISTNTYTTASHASLFTGLYPPGHGIRSFFETKLSGDVFTLAEVLKVYGYETVMMTDTPDLFHPLGLDRGFDHVFHRDDEGLLAWLARNRDSKRFVFVHFFDVHEPFLLGRNPACDNADYRRELDLLYARFDITKRTDRDSDSAAWMRLVDHLGRKDYETFLPLYVRGVTKFDSGRFRSFMDRVKEVGFDRDALLVIFSDHGEGRTALEDPGVFGHGGPLFDSVIRVPLVICHPAFSHRVIDGVVSTIDVFPTVLAAALGGEAGQALPYRSDGISLDSSAAYEGRQVYSETWRNDNQHDATPLIFISSFLEQRGIREGNRKYIVNGTPEIFANKNEVERLGDEEFVQKVFRGLLCRFEGGEEYRREVDYLREKRLTKGLLLQNVRDSLEHLSKPSFMMYDLERDPFEDRPITLEGDSGEAARYVREIYLRSASAQATAPIFDTREVFRKIAGNIASVDNGSLTEMMKNKHLFSLVIEDFLRSRAGVAFERKDAEELITESAEFGRFFLERVALPRNAEIQAGQEAAASRELELIKGSLTYRVAHAAATFVDTKLLPAGSRRRDIVARTFRAFTAKHAVDEGLFRRLKSAVPGRRVLAVTYEVPCFDQYSGAHRFFNLLRMFRELGFSVTILSESPVVRDNYSGPLEELGIDIVYGGNRIHLLKDLPDCFDHVLLHTPSTAGYIDLIRKYCPKANVIFDTSDLHYLRFQREAEVTGSAESLRKAREYRQKEVALAKKSDIVLTVSAKEGDVLRRDAGDVRIAVVPNIHRVEPTATVFEKRRDILFIGAFSHAPNGDAVFYFLREIFPALRERIDMNFYIIGKDPPPELLRLQTPNVIATGYVHDVTTYFEKCRLMVAPLRYGAGVKGKLTQSMSLGLPFVTTPVGAEGMDLVDGQHCFIADGPGAFAARVERLYIDGQLWKTFRDQSLRLALERYSPEAVKRTLGDLFSGTR